MNRLRAVDHLVATELNQLVRRSRLLAAVVARAAAWTASAEVLLMVLLGLSGRPRAALRVFASVSVVYVLVALVGRRWSRARPFARLDNVQELVGHESDRSFPSRHVASAFAMAEVATPASPLIGRLMGTLAWVLALSRVGAGLHYPADVVVGAVLGTVVGRLVRGHWR